MCDFSLTPALLHAFVDRHEANGIRMEFMFLF